MSGGLRCVASKTCASGGGGNSRGPIRGYGWGGHLVLHTRVCLSRPMSGRPCVATGVDPSSIMLFPLDRPPEARMADIRTHRSALFLLRRSSSRSALGGRCPLSRRHVRRNSVQPVERFARNPIRHSMGRLTIPRQNTKSYLSVEKCSLEGRLRRQRHKYS